jgi:AhpD family alkylhydroperoxidase
MTTDAHGPVTDVGGLVRQALGLARVGARFPEIMTGRRLEPRVREAVMVAISADNRCRYCSFIHREWALREGLAREHMDEILARDYRTADTDLWTSVEYARELAAVDFGPLPEARAVFYDRRIPLDLRQDIEAVARAITLANRVGNTFDALLERTSGRPLPGSRPVDEAVVSAAFLAIAPLVAGVMSAWTGKSPRTLARDFLLFSDAFEIESEEHARPA